MLFLSRSGSSLDWGVVGENKAPATRHKMESQLVASEEARGGGDDASGSIRPASQLHLWL